MDRGNEVIRKITPSGEVSTLPGTYGPSSRITSKVDTQGNFYVLTHEAVEDGIDSSSTIYRLDANGNREEIKKFSGGIRTTVPVDIDLDGQGRLYILNVYRGNDHVIRLDPDGSEQMVYHYLSYGQQIGMAVDDTGNIAIAFVGPVEGSSYIVWVPTAAQPTDYQSDDVTTQTLGLALPSSVSNLSFDSEGNLYMTEAKVTQSDSEDGQSVYSDFRVLKIVPNVEVSTFMDTFPDGSTQTRSDTRQGTGFGIGHDASDNLYVSDPNVDAIYRIDSNGNSTLFAGTPGEAGSSD